MNYLGFPGGSDSKESPAMQEAQVRFLGQEDPLENGMATHSSVLAWKSHGKKSLVGFIQSMGSQRVRQETEQLNNSNKTNSPLKISLLSPSYFSLF